MKNLIHILFELALITGLIRWLSARTWRIVLTASKKEMDKNPRAEAIWEHFEQHVGSIVSCGRDKCAILK